MYLAALICRKRYLGCYDTVDIVKVTFEFF